MTDRDGWSFLIMVVCSALSFWSFFVLAINFFVVTTEESSSLCPWNQKPRIVLEL